MGEHNDPFARALAVSSLHYIIPRAVWNWGKHCIAWEAAASGLAVELSGPTQSDPGQQGQSLGTSS